MNFALAVDATDKGGRSSISKDLGGLVAPSKKATQLLSEGDRQGIDQFVKKLKAINQEMKVEISI